MKVLGLLVVLALVLSSCMTAPETSTVDRLAFVRAAESLKGHPYESRVEVRGHRFTLDCVGLLDAAFWKLGYNLEAATVPYRGDAVNRLKAYLKHEGAFFEKPRPEPGDIIFWNNTWDANGDGIWGDDGTTHAGLVVSLASDGTVTYLHASVTRGIALAKLNLVHPTREFSPDGRLWNSPMALPERGHKNPVHWLSGDLCSGIADLRVGWRGVPLIGS